MTWVETIFVAIGSSATTYIFSRKKEKADIKMTEAQTHTIELDATEKAVSIWRSLAEDLRSETLALKQEVKSLTELIERLEEQNVTLKEEIEKLREENGHLKDQIEALKEKLI